MDEHKNKQLDFLLADFQATKSEIARRSNLQKTVLVALIGFYAWLLNYFISSGFEFEHIIVMWTVIALAYIFYQRECYEILRLGKLIRIKIAGHVSQLIDVESKHLIPSEVDSSDTDFDNKTQIYDRLFNSVVFIVIPSVLTLVYFINSECFDGFRK